MKRILGTLLILSLVLGFILIIDTPFNVEEVQATQSEVEVDIGDYIQFGSYYDETILW